MLAGIFTEDFSYDLDNKRKYYLYVITGTARVNDLDLIEGDGLSFDEEAVLRIADPDEVEIILFDLR